jgi:hypothetical protein
LLSLRNWRKKTLKTGISDRPKVKLVAVAKDEAAYLPEWVHHHHYFGFDAIDIYLNRTTDNSVNVLQLLQKHAPSLAYFNADWVDTCPGDAKNYLQFIVYAKALEQEQQAQRFDYLMFLDIDEFWTPQNMATKVQDCIEAQSDAQTISFGWLNQHGSDEPFQPLHSQVKGQLSPLVKTLIKLDAKVDEVALHLPRLAEGDSRMVDGDVFLAERDNRECLHKDLVRLRSTMIIHRMFRSPMEYVSLLSRGRPSDSLLLKLNRGGFNGASGAHVNFALDSAAYLTYLSSLMGIINNADVVDCLVVSRQFVTDRFNQTLSVMADMSPEYYADLFQLFKGCGKNVLEHLVISIRESKRLKECKSVETLLAIAADIQKHDAFLARDIMAMAAKI